MAENTYDKTSEAADTERPVQFTGIVVTYNEDRRLHDCLTRLSFCEQLLVFDLGSKDDSVSIAEDCGAKVIHHEWVPLVEHVRAEAVAHAENDWVVFVDPDEVLPQGIEHDLRRLIEQTSDLAVVKVPMLYYFRGNPLYCTRWGGVKPRKSVFHRDRVRFRQEVFRGKEAMEGYRVGELSAKSGDYHTKHYWVDSYRHLIKKHWRYIQNGASARYESGQRFSWTAMLKQAMKVLAVDLFQYGGIRGGFRGVFLSLFYSWFIVMEWLSLRKYELAIDGGRNAKSDLQ